MNTNCEDCDDLYMLAREIARQEAEARRLRYYDILEDELRMEAMDERRAERRAREEYDRENPGRPR